MSDVERGTAVPWSHGEEGWNKARRTGSSRPSFAKHEAARGDRFRVLGA